MRLRPPSDKYRLPTYSYRSTRYFSQRRGGGTVCYRGSHGLWSNYRRRGPQKQLVLFSKPTINYEGDTSLDLLSEHLLIMKHRFDTMLF